MFTFTLLITNLVRFSQGITVAISGWSVFGVLCDRRVGIKLKGKVHKALVRPAMMYGAETWAIKKTQEKKLDVAEMKMLRWMCGVTRRDKIKERGNWRHLKSQKYQITYKKVD